MLSYGFILSTLHCLLSSSPPPPHTADFFFFFKVEIPSSFISLFICLELHESFLAVGNLNAFRPKWKISEMLDYLFLNKQLTFNFSVATSGFLTVPNESNSESTLGSLGHCLCEGLLG